MRFEIYESQVVKTLDQLHAKLSRSREMLEGLRSRLQQRVRDHWMKVESLPSPRGRFGVRTGALKKSILEGVRIQDRAVVAGSSLFYAGYVDAIVRRRGIPEGLLPELDAEEVVESVARHLELDQ
jgi:hypothetical protein